MLSTVGYLRNTGLITSQEDWAFPIACDFTCVWCAVATCRVLVDDSWARVKACTMYHSQNEPLGKAQPQQHVWAWVPAPLPVLASCKVHQAHWARLKYVGSLPSTSDTWVEFPVPSLPIAGIHGAASNSPLVFLKKISEKILNVYIHTVTYSATYMGLVSTTVLGYVYATSYFLWLYL